MTTDTNGHAIPASVDLADEEMHEKLHVNDMDET